ncbi:MAG: ABC transporter ATP-binding protein [Haloferacaceae archaeon]
MPTSGEPLVELRDVRKEFDDVVAVDGIDLTIRQGEFFSLLGPSGCGKTTTLRMIAGFERPTDGELLLNGTDAIDVPPNKRDTNMVFQHLSLFPHMTVHENVGYGLRKAGVEKGERDRRIQEYLDLVDLAGYDQRQVTELSGGQQQRVAVARSLVNEPSVLLLDEPLASLDRKLRQHMEVELSKIHQKVEGSFFYVTHDQEVAMTLSDRLAVMNEGQIEQVGTPKEIYQNPATEFVADFIGDTNLFECRSRRVNGHAEVTFKGREDVTFTSSRLADEGDVTVSVRPEEIDLLDGDGGLFGATVTERYFQGDHTDYVVVPDDDGLPSIEVTIHGRQARFEEGDAVNVDFDSEEAPVFFA